MLRLGVELRLMWGTDDFECKEVPSHPPLKAHFFGIPNSPVDHHKPFRFRATIGTPAVRIV